MRARNKLRKHTKWSLSAIVWSLVGCVLILHLYSLVHHRDGVGEGGKVHLSRFPLIHELEEIEEELFPNPSARSKRNPRAEKRRPKSAIDPRIGTGNNSLYFYPGRIWLDTDGNPIQAHGGGILYVERTRTYYWYGENKDGPTNRTHDQAPARVDIVGVSCYSSKDLWTWKNEGIVLAGEETDTNHDLHKLNVLERPKVIYNDYTRKYVMWMHVDDANYTKASTGIAVSNYPTGPFEYLYSKRPHGFESRDMTIFKDDTGIAYIIYSSEDNSELHIGPLTDDYLDVTLVMRMILVGQHREAPTLFKYQGTYYKITSGYTGWAPNEALAHAAESMGNYGKPLFRREQDLQTNNILRTEYICSSIGRLSRFIFIHG
ncbi:hypothetical protein MKX01_023586 [Papaver californicum]|nr:hypothetical protein MKX01_023586 [Papaver californicum]